VGWSAAVGWISGIPACAQMVSGLVVGMVLLMYPKIQICELWQVTLITIFWLFLIVGFNMFLAKYLLMAECIVRFLGLSDRVLHYG
jgi:choline transport protein